MPALKVLDFRKVKQAEREAAEKKFGGKDGLKAREAAKTFGSATSAREAGGTRLAGESNVTGPTPQQLPALQAATETRRREEVARLENALSNGVMPSDFQV